MSANPLKTFLSAGDSASASGLSPVDAILDAVRHHLGMEIAFASRYVDGRRQFTHIRTELPVPSAPGDSEPNEESYCHHILEGRLPELIHNAQDLEFAKTLGITAALPVGAHMDVPLRLKDGSVYGSFCCLSRTPDYTLTDRDLSTLRAFAELAAIQIESELDSGRDRQLAMDKIDLALRQGQPAIVYQPIHDLRTGEARGVEALSRFADAEKRPPCDWFDEASKLGRGIDLEMAAVEAALAGLPYLVGNAYLAVNASPELVISGALMPLAAAAPTGRIVVELTEHAQVDDYGQLRVALKALRQHARIAIDDVGAGYSSLRHILDLEPDLLKLDMSLTRDVDRDPARQALIGAMVSFASGIGAAIIAEGVETVGEASALAELGVDYGQGWHFGRPMPAVAIQHHLLKARGDPLAASPGHSRRLLLGRG